jgi:hypothetical protein
MQNGEREVNLHSIIVHETQTGYAQGFKSLTVLFMLKTLLWWQWAWV